MLSCILDFSDDKNKARNESLKKAGGGAPPPQPLKKPTKNNDTKQLMSQTDDHKAQEQQIGLYIGTGSLTALITVYRLAANIVIIAGSH